jgi:toxin-antitoxin system PIN domain toxin
MRALLDVNCLLALLDEDHSSHSRALLWWQSDRPSGWATCPLTQNGFARISSQSSYASQRPLNVAIEQLARLMTLSDHEFWSDDVSIADDRLFDHGYILGPNQITDVYLLGLAVKNGGRLVTFDRGLPLKAVRSAEARHLVVL